MAVAVVLVMYKRAFAGMMTYVGADGGVHAYQYDLFTHDWYDIYEGFDTMYAFVYWMRTLVRANLFWAFTIALYTAFAFGAAIPATITVAAVDRYERKRAFIAGTIAGMAALVTVSWFVVLPLDAYHQTDGFWAHVFGIIPLFAIWMADAVVDSATLRVLGVTVGVVVYRFTYGLNLPDLVAVVALWLLIEAFAFRGVCRWCAIAAAAGAAPVAILLYRRLLPIFGNWGWFVDYDVPRALRGELIAIAVLAIGLVVAALARRRVLRALRFPLLFGIISTIAFVRIAKLPPATQYYFLKYNLHAVLLTAAGAAVAVAIVAAEIADRARVAAIAAAALGLTLFAWSTRTWQIAFRRYQPMFHERVFGTPPWKELRPLADLGAWTRIEKILAHEHKLFGGYITANWSMFNFMNAALGYYNGGRQFWEHRAPRQDPGYCVFWEGGVPYWPNDDSGYQLKRARELLEADSDKQCVSYRAHWERRQRTLCHRCY
jgi:MFS family permease